MSTIAVDAMGGDHAPRQVVLGALRALARDRQLRIALVGQTAELQSIVAAAGRLPPAADGSAATRALDERRAATADPTDRLAYVHATGAVPMDAAPVAGLRQHAASSLERALALVHAGEADALFSAGNTGAVAVAATLALGRRPGVRRPGIAVSLPTAEGRVTLVDVGANLNPRAEDLAAYADLGAAWARAAYGVDAPRVALLNIGHEQGKGGPLLARARELCEQALGDRFIGFVEGHEVLSGAADVVVCDAFTGNAVLKTAEGVQAAVLAEVERELALALAQEPAATQERVGVALSGLRRRGDFAQYGGAPLLGVGGIVIIGHGRSDEHAVANGILLAARAARFAHEEA